MQAITDAGLRKLALLLSIYITALLASNTLGLKIMPFLFGSHLSVGVFMFPFVFLMTDVVGEVYGKRVAKFFVYAGFASTALFIIFSVLSLALPWSADGAWAQSGYDTIFAVSLRISIASLIAFIVGEYQDVLSFFFFRAKWGGRFFWLRSFIAGLWSQFLDTVLFMIIAFYGVYPNSVLFSLIVSWWLYKVLMGALYSPLMYAGLWFLREKPAEAK